MTRTEPMARDKQSDKDEMSLPEGKMCNDCVHCARCCLIFGHIPRDEVCDWAPSRFQERQSEEGTL